MDTDSYSSRQDKSRCSGIELRRIPNDLQMTQPILDSGNQNVTNLLLPNSQVPTTNPLLSYQSSFGGLYSSPNFNTSLTGYENNMQWLTDGRMQNQHNQLTDNFSSDKSTINPNIHSLPPTTSHSCCVNRFGVLDSLPMGSPLPAEQIKSACDVSSFQNKSNISMNMIDPIQSWLNLQIPTNNQQYCKYGERSLTQNYNTPVSLPSQMNLPIIDQSDLKQSDLCIQSPDSCYKTVTGTNNNVKHIDNGVNGLKHNQYVGLVENKLTMPHENNTIFKQQGSYQSNIMQKDWKSTFQSMQNYISSPNVFNAVSDSQENFIFPQYNMPNSFYSTSESYAPYTSVNKNSSSCMSHTKPQNRNSSSVQNIFIEQSNAKPAIVDNSKSQNNVNSQYISKHTGIGNQSSIMSQGNVPMQSSSFSGTMSDCCQIKKTQLNSLSTIDNTGFEIRKNVQENKCITNPKSSVSVDIDNQNNKASFKNAEGISSESEESNIIVEESDDLGEIGSEISIEEIKKSYKSNEACSGEVLLKCVICNVATSSRTPANHFIHMDDSFPVTSTRTPVCTKLEQVLPIDLQQLFNYLKVHNSFLCRRCLNLIETLDLLEVKLTSAKQTISDQFSKTVQLLMPEIEQLLHDQSNVSESNSSGEHDKRTQVLLKRIENEGSEGVDQIVSDSESVNEFQCCYCSKILSSQKTYHLHLQQHTREFSFYCERCGKGFPLKSALERHLNWHNGVVANVEMLCELCGEIFSSKHIFYSHQIKTHERNYSFQCETCGKGFTRKVSLEIHRLKHSGKHTFMCEYCGRTLVSESSLKSHIKTCTKDFLYKCNNCEKSFATDTQLKKHESQHTGVYKLKCSVCDKGFNKPSDLKHHMLSHSDERRYKCTECSKTFKTAFNLNYHSRVVHKKENLFKCTVCGKHFGQQTLLADHMNVHTKEKPYNCTQCGKSFVHQTTFITHLKTHTDKKKSKTCTVCGKDITTRMSVHMRSHTGEKPYKCTYCPMAFSVGISLKKHIEAKHCKKTA